MGNKITYYQDSIQTDSRLEALSTSDRKKIAMGFNVIMYNNGQQKFGSIVYHTPSPYQNQTEAIYFKGPPGSGKSWAAYALAGQSFFAENRTWIVLDTKFSVTRETPIYVKINGLEKIVTIGELVDYYLPCNDMYSMVASITDPIEILSVNHKHQIQWMPVKSVSKHKSPEELLRITTRGNRKVTATAGHSFLTLKNGKYTSIKGSDLKIGDHLPMSGFIPSTNELREITVTNFLDNDKIIDYDLINSTINNMQNYQVAQAYNKSGLNTISYGGFIRYVWEERTSPEGYFKYVTDNHSKSTPFPKKLALTELFGFFCGMFLAEGYASDKKGQRHITITNYTKENLDKVKEWLDELHIKWTSMKDHGKEKAIVVSSIVLSKLFIKWFGNEKNVTNSVTKHVPDWFFNTNLDFIRGVLDGYMSGDGHIRPLPRHDISFSTISKQLLEDITRLFLKFNISVNLSQFKSQYCGSIYTSDLCKFKQIGFTDPAKKERLEQYQNFHGWDSKHLVDIKRLFTGIGWRNVKGSLRNRVKSSNDYISIGNALEIYDDLNRVRPSAAKELLEMINGDIWWDEIKSIEHLCPESDYVYDLQIDETENFMLANGLIVHNSYLGNNRPNLRMLRDLNAFGLDPLGIPGTSIDIIAPQYYVEGLTPSEIHDTWVTDYYRVPLRFCSMRIITELTKLNDKASYAGSFESRFRDLLIRTNNRPRIQDLTDMLNEIVAEPEMRRFSWIYGMVAAKIIEISRWTLDDSANEWSAVGNALLNAVADGQRAGHPVGRWVVFTLAHSDHPEDYMNLAIVSCVLTEISAFAKFARMHNLPIKLGVIMDELHTYVRNKNASTREAIHDLLFAWGRTSGILRLFLTQKDEQLDKVFRDDITKIASIGSYQTIFSCYSVPEPGRASYLNRLEPSRNAPGMPYYLQEVKLCPPLFDVESSEPDDEKWLKKMEQLHNSKPKQKMQYAEYYSGIYQQPVLTEADFVVF